MKFGFIGNLFRSMSKSKVTLARLQQLAVQGGINKSGTKKAIIAGLRDSIRCPQPLSPDSRILSIDIGIRNLAFSLLTPPRSQAGLPTVHAWTRMALSAKSTEVPEDFSPAAMSQVAASLVAQHLLPLRPSHVLIERQRFRSAGSPTVFEWTLRANVLEAMLYATFSTLRLTGQWDGMLVPVFPKRVSSFLLAPQVAADQSDSTRTKRHLAIKKEKIDLVGSWLASEEAMLFASKRTKVTAEQFLRRWKGGRAGKVSKGAQDMQDCELSGACPELGTKLDDLADCLLQGIAWLRWQVNLDSTARLPEIASLLEALDESDSVA